MINPITIGAAVIIAVLSIACATLWKVAGHERNARAVAEANAKQWKETAEECSAKTEKLAKEGKDRAAAALAALRRAQAANKGGAAEIARLRASSAADCKAAVAEVRKGLK